MSFTLTAVFFVSSLFFGILKVKHKWYALNGSYTQTVCVLLGFDLFFSDVHKGNTHNTVELLLLLYPYPKLDGWIHICAQVLGIVWVSCVGVRFPAPVYATTHSMCVCHGVLNRKSQYFSVHFFSSANAISMYFHRDQRCIHQQRKI